MSPKLDVIVTCVSYICPRALHSYHCMLPRPERLDEQLWHHASESLRSVIITREIVERYHHSKCLYYVVSHVHVIHANSAHAAQVFLPTCPASQP